DSMIALADVKRTDENGNSEALAMKTSPYRFESDGQPSRSPALAQTEATRVRTNDLMALRPALSSTRGMK
ncbi:MAG: M23 family peptidase, partial [Asticcacaulis sp.]